MALPPEVQNWFIPLSESAISLAEASSRMQAVALDQGSIPWLVQLVENPKYNLPGVEIFSGATDLMTHDLIHLLLGRGVMPKDEAFVLGFTMGSSNRVGNFQHILKGSDPFILFDAAMIVPKVRNIPVTRYRKFSSTWLTPYA